MPSVPSASSSPFSFITWSDEAIESIVVENSDNLNTHWKFLQNGLDDPQSTAGITTAGNLNLPTGRVFATDLNFVADNLPFRRAVLPGTYPVYRYVITAGAPNAAVVINAAVTPKSWVVADAYGDLPADLKNPNGLWGVSLDSSMILVDAAICKTSGTVPAAKGSPMQPNIVTVDLGGVGVAKPYWGLDKDSKPVVLLIVY